MNASHYNLEKIKVIMFVDLTQVTFHKKTIHIRLNCINCIQQNALKWHARCFYEDFT